MLLNLNVCAQASQLEQETCHTWGGGVYCVQAGVDGESHHDKRMKKVAGSLPVVPNPRLCGDIVLSPLWPHSHSNREKTRTIIVADHPPDPAQRWDFANWVKWLDGETGQGTFVEFGNFLDRLQPSLKSTSGLNDEST